MAAKGQAQASNGSSSGVMGVAPFPDLPGRLPKWEARLWLRPGAKVQVVRCDQAAMVAS